MSHAPWRTVRTDHQDWVVMDSRDFPVALLGYTDGEANARLIAAAPDMSALLCEIENYLSDCADVNWEGTGPNKAMALLTEVREVLDKAGILL